MLTVFFILNSTAFLATPAYDTSGIYSNKLDFEKDILHLKTNHKIRISSRPFWTNFSINEEAVPIKVRLPDGNHQVLNPGSFYGFKTQGVKFIYIKYLEEYLAVLNDKPPLYLFVRKKVHFSNIVAFSDETFYFSTTLNDDSLKEFNNENIKTSFGDNTITTKILIELLNKIKQEGLDAEMHKKQFLRCKELVEDYLSKLKSQ